MSVFVTVLYCWHLVYAINVCMHSFDVQVVLYLSSIELVKVLLDNVRLRVPKHIPQFLAQISESHFVDCNQQQAAQFVKEFGPVTEDDDAKQFGIAATDLLSRAGIVLNGLGVRFWISSGTCLGEWQC